MSKFPLCHKFIIDILDFDFFKLDDSWKDFLSLFLELQTIETKKERLNQDARKCLRLERELIALLGENIIDDLSIYYRMKKSQLMADLINSQDNNGDSILHISAFHGDFKIVGRLVFYGGNKKLKNNKGQLPVDLAKDNFVRKVLTNLNKAAKASDEKNIKELVNFGKDINEKISIFWQAPIHKIIESKDPKKHDVLQKMLDLGSDPNIKDSNGWSALHYACQLGDFESVEILVNIGATIDTYSNNKRIPLHLAAYRGYPNIVEFLLKSGSDPSYKDELGCTPLHLAAKKGHVKCLELMLSYDDELLYCLDFRNWNILHYASFHGHKKAVRFIAKYDADYDFLQTMRNSQNKMPIEIVRDPSVKPYFNTLWHAAREGNLDLTRNLLNEGEDINEQSHFELNTPLHLAVLNNHYLEVRLLIESNCILNMKNKDGLEPYHYAYLMNQPIQSIYEISEDLERDTLDLREIVSNFVLREENVINSMISKKNQKLRVWTAVDFNSKIVNLMNSKLEEIKENENENEEEQNNNENNKENTAQNDNNQNAN
jgi:ankyrin repeat protein